MSLPAEHLFWCAIWLTAGNFTYQALTNALWPVAVERSYFQCAALLLVYAYAWVRKFK